MIKLFNNIVLLVFTLLILSCSQNSGRSVASYNGGDIYEVGAIKMSVLPYNIFIERYGPVWRAFDGATIKGTELNAETGITELPEGKGMVTSIDYNSDFEAGRPKDFFPSIIATREQITENGGNPIPILPVNYYIKVDSCPDNETNCK